jgi:ATP-dependent DNA helicase RecG
MAGFFNTPIEYLKGIGPQRAEMLNKDLNIFTFGDLIQHYPFRYEDRTKFYSIAELSDEMLYVQVKGKVLKKELIGVGPKKRLTAQFSDGTGILELFNVLIG